MNQQILIGIAVTAILAAIGFCVLAAVMHGQRDAFRKAYNALVLAANRSADEATRLENHCATLVELVDRYDHDRQKLATQLRPANDTLRRWAIENPTRAIKDLDDLLSKAFVSGPNGRLVRLVPKVPTDG